MTWVRTLHLAGFRSYHRADLANLPPGAVVLHGPNGAGKTNVLEALSLLAPGRGLRGAKPGEIQKKTAAPEGGCTPAWSIAATLETPWGEARIGTGADPTRDNKRLVRINGAPARAQAALGEYVAAVWLTPQMDRLFLDGAAGRRRFLDRLVFAFDPGHAGRVTRYENALRQRSKLLQDGRPADPAWLDALEITMAETGTALAAARVQMVEQLQDVCNREDSPAAPFPLARLAVTGTLEDLLRRAPALEAEELLHARLRESRIRDALTGGAETGPHKSDLAVRYAAKNMPAAQCSTGEQKALLIGIVLAHGGLIGSAREMPPLLLLDEIGAHLDDARRAALYERLLATGGQVWLTGTDEALFTALRGRAAFFHVTEGDFSETDRATDTTENVTPLCSQGSIS